MNSRNPATKVAESNQIVHSTFSHLLTVSRARKGMSTLIWVSDPGERANSAYAIRTFSFQSERTDVNDYAPAGASLRMRVMSHKV